MTVAIGDIQGCHGALQALLHTVRRLPGEPLWLCGDLVNRGPDSLGTLRTVRALGPQARTVLGNHDLHLLALAAGARGARRGDTLDPILTAPDRTALIDWLRHQPLAVKEGDYLMVHAGVLPEWDAEQVMALAGEVEAVLRGPDWGDFMREMYGNEPDRWEPRLTGVRRLRLIVNVLTRIRYLTPDGRLDLHAKDAPPESGEARHLIPWFEAPGRRTALQTLVFGHWSTLGLVLRPNLLALDTGCVWGGSLTAVRLETREQWSQRSDQTVAPGSV